MYPRIFITVLISLVLLTGSKAQIHGVDTLFRFTDLYYLSETESASFREYFEDEPDFLKMILTIDANVNEEGLKMYRDWINEIILDIRQKKIDRLSEEKIIDQIKKSLRNTLLINFKLQSNFSDLFSYGNYNYLTAVSVYALILDQLEIPYEIHERPSDIYLLAFPEHSQVPIEIIGPGHQYFMFDHETRKNFVDYIQKSHAADDSTFNVTSTRVLFERYYFAGYALSLRDMVGLLYLNSGIDYLNKPDEAMALYQFEKAFLLHPSYKIQYILLGTLNGFLINMDYHNPLDLGYLIKASKLIGFGMERDLINDFLRDIIHTLVIGDEDEEGARYVYDYLQEFLEDETLKKEISFLYHYETGRMHYNDGLYAKAMNSLAAAYTFEPGNKTNLDLLVNALGAYAIMASPGMVLEKLNHYDTVFTEIIDDEIYLLIKVEVCLKLSGESFQLEDGMNGEYYLAIFEGIADQHPDIPIDHMLVGRSYSSAAIFYYRKGRVEKSRKVLEKGLSYAPYNIELKLKLKSFE